MNKLLPSENFGFIKPLIDAHTLGITTVSQLLNDCGFKTFISNEEVSEAVTQVQKVNNLSLITQWINKYRITRVGFSYRLDPRTARDYFCKFFYAMRDCRMFATEGGPIRDIFFAGLPDSCELIRNELGKDIMVFKGDETPFETLTMLGVPLSKLPSGFLQDNAYDNMRWDFATNLLASEIHKTIKEQNHSGYSSFGKNDDTYLDRLNYCKQKHTLPLIRAHVGPYNPNRIEAIKEFRAWVKDLANAGLLDVLSIGSSQLTQSNFGENWDGLSNGGGVPVNSELEYRQIKSDASSMLVRTYAGTKDVPGMAILHERCLNIAWHAFSFWWFCEIDGRGKNSVLENLKEHFEAIKYVASTGKPIEPNVPHHFAFRGADDITYIISAYLAAKSAKKQGIKHLILQNMLNTPKYTWGTQDLVKGRVMLKLVKELEDASFSVSLQSRAGLDYFSPDIEKAKIQLASVTALMDDIEPNNINSPEIIHVVSYSEAVRLATPSVINESIQITLAALREYRKLREKGKIPNMSYDREINQKCEEMYEDAKSAIHMLERHIPYLYTPEGLFYVFKEGFLPVPYLFDIHNKYPNATNCLTAIRNGGIRVVDKEGNIVDTVKRYKLIVDRIKSI